MTEEDWLRCDDLDPMLKYLGRNASDRKLRLFGCACGRRVLDFVVKDGLAPDERMIDRWERYADDPCCFGRYVCLHGDETEWGVANRYSTIGWFLVGRSGLGTENQERKEQAAILREIFGNPFRTISINPTWLTTTVSNLATVAYEQHALPSGELDTTRLEILADALEDAGCDNQEILVHLRCSGPHVRGCHVLDLLLDKERHFSVSYTIGVGERCRGGNQKGATWIIFVSLLGEIQIHGGSVTLEIEGGPKIGPQTLQVQAHQGKYLLMLGENHGEDYNVRSFNNLHAASGQTALLGNMWSSSMICFDFAIVCRAFDEFFYTGNVSHDLLK
jgi:hypothetical protein